MAFKIAIMNEGITVDGVTLARGDIYPEEFESIQEIPSILGTYMIVGKESAGEIDPRFLTDERIKAIEASGPIGSGVKPAAPKPAAPASDEGKGTKESK